MNYATLVSTVKSYLENSFPETPSSGGLTSTEQLDTFIKQAEQRIYSSVQLPVFRKSGTMTCVNGTATVETPSDWKAPYSVMVTSGTTRSFLLNKDVEFIYESFPTTSTTGVPQFYALKDDNTLLLGPTPDSGYTLTAEYFYHPASIVTASTTWLGDNFDQVLLYGTLLEAATFMQVGAGQEDAGLLANYQQRYADALAQLKQFGEGKSRQDTYRTTQTRYPVN